MRIMQLNIEDSYYDSCSLHVGSFYPWFKYHEEYLVSFKNLSKFNPLICLIFPAPFLLLREQQKDDPLPHTEILETTIARLERFANVMVCHFEDRDLSLSPEVFFETLQSVCNVNELFLRPRQTIGRGIEGSQQGLTEYLKGFGATVSLLPSVDEKSDKLEVFNSLRRGKVRRYFELTGIYPSIDTHRDQSEMGWPNGKYIASCNCCGSEVNISFNGAITVSDYCCDNKVFNVLKGPGDHI